MCLAKQQYKPSDEAKAKSQAYEQMDDRYKRWTEEDLRSSGQMDQINQQVSAKEAEFNKARETALRGLSNMRGGTLGQQDPVATALAMRKVPGQFNADQMRRDLMREAALKRVESGVYSRQNITADTPSQQVSVIGGASSRAASGSTSGVSRGGRGSDPRTGPTGVKLNIGT